jgi:hypothetical protein
MSNRIINQEWIDQLRAELSNTQAQIADLTQKQQDILEKLTYAISGLNAIREIAQESVPTNAPEVIDLTSEFDVVDLSDDDGSDVDVLDRLHGDWLHQSEIDGFMRRLEQADLFGSNEEYLRVEAECIEESRSLASERRGLMQSGLIFRD